MSLISPRPRPVRLFAAIAILVALVIGLTAFQYFRAVPATTARAVVPTSSAADGTPPVLPWPAKGAGAVAASDIGLLAVGGPTTAQPMFSVAKVMTALAILEDKPLKVGEQGPTITVDAADVTIYKMREAAGESVVPVAAGEQLTEYQALQGLLIPSGNNIGVLLSKWDVGSEAAMVARLNVKAKALHLANTTFDDVSGASIKSTSVPSELVVMGMLAMRDPVIASIVSQVDVVLPVAGKRFNVDYALGQENIVGIKTGSSPDGGANFIFASTHAIEGRPVLIVGAVMGLNTLDEAFAASKALIRTVRPALGLKHVVLKDQTVARYQTPWGSKSDIVAQQALDVVTWPGMVVRTHFEARPVNPPLATGSKVGIFSVKTGEQALQTSLVTADGLTKPPTRYKLTRTDL